MDLNSLIRRLLNWYSTDANKVTVKRVEELVQKKNASMAQISLAWVMHRDGVTAPIIGTTSLKNLEDLIGAVHIKLSDEEMKYLEESYIPMAVIGHQ
ncbi:Aldo/keto reductase [Schizopora paradoxa]|uniref:Aldo/keto reductase n=1 Tax=Schizopora paradoxa TaxID=27342 RepID=A0A0H2R5E6_9AGAM|nr:Aldo/keto reductase [Schizopora paradoxa]